MNTHYKGKLTKMIMLWSLTVIPIVLMSKLFGIFAVILFSNFLYCLFIHFLNFYLILKDQLQATVNFEILYKQILNAELTFFTFVPSNKTNNLL